MLEKNILSTTNLHKYYADRILDITRNISVTPIVWQDVWDEHVQVESFFFYHLSLLHIYLVTTGNDHSSLERFQR